MQPFTFSNSCIQITLCSRRFLLECHRERKLKLNQKVITYDYSSEEDNITFASETNFQLLGKVAVGDELLFKELYNRYNLRLFNYISRLVHDDDAAEDILQEVFLAIWKGASRFRGQSKVNTWIYKIAHNQTATWLRRNKRGDNHNDLQQRVEISVPEHTHVETWRREQIQIALNKLSPKHRAVIELAFFYDLSYSEIAQVVGCPEGTVKSRMSYARSYLNMALNELGINNSDNN